MRAMVGLAAACVAATAAAVALAGPSAADGSYTSIFTSGGLKGGGWAACPSAVVWNADVSGLSAKTAGYVRGDIAWALGQWGGASGVAVREGAEELLGYDNSSATVLPSAGGDTGRRILVKFVADKDSTYLSGQVVGVATPTSAIMDAQEFLQGSAAFRTDYVEHASKSELRALLLHELGHAMGLGHSTDKKSVMYPTVSQATTLTQGDLSGIKEFTKACDPSFEAMRER